eukprot:720702-Alexandrium_andersonii.AAC.1
MPTFWGAGGTGAESPDSRHRLTARGGNDCLSTSNRRTSPPPQEHWVRGFNRSAGGSRRL